MVRRSIYSDLEKEGHNTKSDSKQVVRTLGQRLTIMAILGLVVITVLFGINQIVQRAANMPPGNGQGTGSGAIAQDVSVWTQTSKYDFDRGNLSSGYFGKPWRCCARYKNADCTGPL